MHDEPKSILQRLDELDIVLTKKGFPPISDWWRNTFRRWYTLGKRQLVVRCGRRGGKSSSLCRLAVVEALFGEHAIPPGDVGVVAIVSARRTDALERLRTIRAILDALGEEYSAKVESIELKSKPVVFTVFTASIAGVSGFTGIFVLCDEVSKWRDASTGANPAKEVIGSIRPTLATQKNAKLVLSSSPMGKYDAHALSFADGETSLQCAAFAPTWVANPTVTEEETRGLEPNAIVWAREYAAIPQDEDEDSILSSVILSKVTRATGAVSRDDRHAYVAVLDHRSEPWALSVGCMTDGDVRRVVLARTCSTFDDVYFALAPYRLKHVYCPDFAEVSMREAARKAGVGLIASPWVAATLGDAYEELKTLAQNERLDLPASDEVRAALVGIRARGAGYVIDSSLAPCIAMLVSLLRAPPKPLPMTAEQEDIMFRAEYLANMAKERKRAARYGALPVTHLRHRR